MLETECERRCLPLLFTARQPSSVNTTGNPDGTPTAHRAMHRVTAGFEDQPLTVSKQWWRASPVLAHWPPLMHLGNGTRCSTPVGGPLLKTPSSSVTAGVLPKRTAVSFNSFPNADSGVQMNVQVQFQLSQPVRLNGARPHPVYYNGHTNVIYSTNTH